MAITGNKRLRHIVVLIICVVWGINILVLPILVPAYQPTDLNPLIMAIIAALLIDKSDNDNGNGGGKNAKQ